MVEVISGQERRKNHFVISCSCYEMGKQLIYYLDLKNFSSLVSFRVRRPFFIKDNPKVSSGYLLFLDPIYFVLSQFILTR